VKNCANQFGIKGRNQKEQSMEIERERKLKKSTWKMRNQRIVDQRIVDSVDVCMIALDKIISIEAILFIYY
jgi:hypothetical protein